MSVLSSVLDFIVSLNVKYNTPSFISSQKLTRCGWLVSGVYEMTWSASDIRANKFWPRSSLTSCLEYVIKVSFLLVTRPSSLLSWLKSVTEK